MAIEILDPIHCKADKDSVDVVKNLLSFKKQWAKRTRFGTTMESYMAKLVSRNGEFLSGHLSRIIQQHPEIEIIGEFERVEPTTKPHLKGITPRKDQLQLVDQAVESQRGILLSPTGSGKTIVAMLLFSRYPSKKILFLCHNISIIEQTATELKKFGFQEPQILGGGKSNFKKSAKITLSTIQTFVKIDPEKFVCFFDILMVDEAHHVGAAQYKKVLESSLAPMRIGLTATMPEGREKILLMEGLLGPIIGEVTVQQGVKEKILAKPKIKLIPIPYAASIGEYYKYPDIYRSGIVENRTRNRLILEEIKQRIEKGETTLVMVKEIAHGDNLVKMAEDLFGLDVVFIQGKTEEENRQLIQKTLDKKIIKCVVCTAIWREGVNIKSLNTVILALGGKSAIQTAQALGRGLRTAKGKTKVRLTDFLDPYKYLAQHSVARVSLYVKNGWL
jgi:superfamily II DNA or RNA helicase